MLRFIEKIRLLYKKYMGVRGPLSPKRLQQTEYPHLLLPCIRGISCIPEVHLVGFQTSDPKVLEDSLGNFLHRFKSLQHLIILVFSHVLCLYHRWSYYTEWSASSYITLKVVLAADSNCSIKKTHCRRELTNGHASMSLHSIARVPWCAWLVNNFPWVMSRNLNMKNAPLAHSRNGSVHKPHAPVLEAWCFATFSVARNDDKKRTHRRLPGYKRIVLYST